MGPTGRGGGKRIEILENLTFTHRSETVNLDFVENYVKSLNINQVRNRRIIERSGIKRIHLTYHARQRWNTRVGPTTISDDELTDLISILCLQLGRVALLSKDVGLIDNDIIFIYEQSEDQMNILTFYGRVSQRPALADVNQLKLFNYKELDEVNFELHQEELRFQILPPIPYKRLIYNGSFSHYCLDVYDNGRGDTLFHLAENSPKSDSDTFFRLGDDELTLSKSTITALKYLRYR